MTAYELEELNQDELARFVIQVFRRAILHYGMWFNEVHHQLGLEEAMRTEEEVSASIFPTITKHLSKVLDFNTKNGLPVWLVNMEKEKLIDLIDAMSVNWLRFKPVGLMPIRSD